jgi:hypothetical protein
MKILLFIFIFYVTVYASDIQNIDEYIKDIQNSPKEERYKKMNELKRILRTKQTSFRKNVLMQLQKNVNHKSDIPTFDKHRPTPDLEKPPVDFDKPTVDFDKPTIDFDKTHIDFDKPPMDFDKPPADFDHHDIDHIESVRPPKR